MHILLAQFYSSQPTPDYDKVATELRGLGHTVWVGTPNAAGDVEWRDGDGIAWRTLPAYPTLPNHRTDLVPFRPEGRQRPRHKR